MIYGRRYVQFNNLVIDSSEMIDIQETDVSFKYISHEKSFGNGSYAPFKRDYMFTEEGSVTLTITLYVDRLHCENRPFYRQWAISELVKQGKLWAVQNNELIWAYAVVTNYSDVTGWRRDIISFTVDFTLPEGIWHKADLQKTFLKPWDICTFMDCYDFKELKPCLNLPEDGDCCELCNSTDKDVLNVGCQCCECETICRDYALCYHLDELQLAFNQCDSWGYQIEYNCRKAQEFFGNDYIGQKFCAKDSCSGIIAGNVYANTDLPTTGVDIILHGYMVDPAITINGNTNIIEGDFSDTDGVMTIKSNGDVYYRESDCCADSLVSPNAWTVPDGNEYGWQLNTGGNTFIVHTNMCCGRPCAYVQIDGLTI